MQVPQNMLDETTHFSCCTRVICALHAVAGVIWGEVDTVVGNCVTCWSCIRQHSSGPKFFQRTSINHWTFAARASATHIDGLIHCRIIHLFQWCSLAILVSGDVILPARVVHSHYWGIISQNPARNTTAVVHGFIQLRQCHDLA